MTAASESLAQNRSFKEVLDEKAREEALKLLEEGKKKMGGNLKTIKGRRKPRESDIFS
jgi:hypothetical protein